MPEILLLFPLLLICTRYDIQEGRIPNKAIAAGLLAVACAALLRGGALSLLRCLLRFFFPVVLLAPLTRHRLMGAGDVKMYALLCAFFGMSGFFRIFVYSIFSAACEILTEWLIFRLRRRTLALMPHLLLAAVWYWCFNL